MEDDGEKGETPQESVDVEQSAPRDDGAKVAKASEDKAVGDADFNKKVISHLSENTERIAKIEKHLGETKFGGWT